jgi:hypothetical protein
VRAARQALDLDRKDALQRRSLVLDADVRGVEAELPADLVAMHDASVDRVGAAEQARGVFESAGLQRVANRRTRSALAVEGDAVHGLDLKAEAGAGSAQQREVAGAPGAEAKIVADDQMPDAQRVEAAPAR